MKRHAVIAVGLIAVGFPALGQTNLVKNGNFAATTSYTDPTTPFYPSNGYGGELGYNLNATSWNAQFPLGSYTMLFHGATDSDGTTAVNNLYGNANNPPGAGNFGLWSNSNGGTSGISGVAVPGGAGANFIAMEAAAGTAPAFAPVAITQTINNLTPGQHYTLTFYWAAAQQFGFTGPTTEDWRVSFGSSAENTPTYSLSTKSVSAWMLQTMTFTADSTSDTLSFLAQGTPTASEPPGVLLADVDLTSVPEVPAAPAALIGLMVVGGVAARLRRRNRK